MSLNKDFEDVYEFYVQSLIDMIGKQHDHVDVNELQSIWRSIKKPLRKRKPRPPNKTFPTVDLEYQKRKTHLESMRYDDLYRHCIRNGLQPPNNKNDMIKVILTRMYPS